MQTALLALSLLAGLSGAAQASGPFRDEPAGPRALPGDNLPPFGMRDDTGKLPPAPPLPSPPPGGFPAWTVPGPDMAESARMVHAAVIACAAKGFHVGAAVIDSGGRMRAMLEGVGADGSHGFVAMRKAEAALTFAMPSSQVGAAIAADPALMAKVTPAMFVEGGAVPIRRGGRIIGAIGVSGAAGAPIGRRDELCALAALHT